MPRRAVTRTSVVPSIPASTPPAPSLSDTAYHSNLFTLRRCWKWAAFSQFFFTFAPLFAMNDVSISDIEEDLARSTRLHLPRVIQRLLYVLTQDRKISLDNWQSALRKQYARRDPAANPIGFEPKKVNLRYSFEPIEVKDEPTTVSLDAPDASVPPEGSVEPQVLNRPHLHAQSDDGETLQADYHQPSSPNGPKSEHEPDSPSDEHDELKDWLELPMLTKLDSLHLLTEWQFHNPNRIKTIMKDDDETAQWRIEPIGYDAKSNAYWFIGAERLWLQRQPHRPKSLKRKRAPAATVDSHKSKRTPPEPNGRRRKATGKRRKIEDEGDSETESSIDERQINIVTTGTSMRAAKTKANKKLDAQAKALAEFQRQNQVTSRNSRVAKKQKSEDEEAEFSTPRRTLGTRLSRRLRGAANEEDEWQKIPDEWLGDNDKTPQAAKKDSAQNLEKIAEANEENDVPGPVQPMKVSKLKTGLESDVESISDLTELSTNSDEDEDENDDQMGKEDRPETIDEQDEEREPSPVAGDLVEWEMICSTMEEWEHVAERFEGATHYAEKALYKLLSNHIVPAVIEDLQEAERVKQEEERKKHVEEAVVHRKRSSRIAIKESEKEEARMVAQRKTDEVEKMSRAKRLEVRLKREEAEREKKERAKEQRRIEREQGANTAPEIDESSVDASRETSSSSTRIANSSQIGSNWELDCEICRRRSINQDEGVPLMCCGSCNKWQHIQCHDAADRNSGQQPRNWEVEEFFCSSCRSRATAGLLPQQHDQYRHPQNYARAKIQLRWDHGRSSPKSQQTVPRIEPLPDPRLRLDVPNLVNGGSSFHQPVHNEQYPPEPYSNITFSHYQPQHRGFSSSSGQGLPHQPQPPPPQPLSQPHSSHSPTTYPPYNTEPVHPQPYGPQSGFNEGYRVPPVPSSLQNGAAAASTSWDTPRGYINAPGMNYSHASGYGITQDSRIYHQQHQPVTSTSSQWRYGSPQTQSSHLNTNGAGAPMDYGM